MSRRKAYIPTITTSDVLNISRLHIGATPHVKVLDLIRAIRSEDEEDLVRMVLYGWTQADIAIEYGVNQSSVSRRLATILRHAT